MFILGQLFSSLALLFNMIFNVIYFLLVIRIILSWFGVNRYNELVQILFRITEPILAPFRRLPLQMGAMDFSPIIAFIILAFLRNFVVGLLTQLAYRFG
ncbi:MAG: YggT family protein [Candidatus Omnitrophica bacterium]|nr:YggT family protein [Candidatus Omnitrophota bacterium]